MFAFANTWKVSVVVHVFYTTSPLHKKLQTAKPPMKSCIMHRFPLSLISHAGILQINIHKDSVSFHLAAKTLSLAA